MRTHVFTSRIDHVGDIPATATVDEIRDETMLFSASPQYAQAVGGPLTRTFLANARGALAQMDNFCRAFGMHIVIDTRSHMLMPGFYPAIPGWHCDAFPRGTGGQPDLTRTTDGAHHIVAFCSDSPLGVSRTQFVQHGKSISLDVDECAVWSSVHRGLANHFSFQSQHDGEILRFSQGTLHRATPAARRGWRWWIRASCYPSEPRNEIRRQVQVYAPEGLGW